MAISKRTRVLVLQHDGFKCRFCGRGVQDGVKLHVDHIYPQARGGPDTLDNLATLCDACNTAKSDLYLGDYSVPSAGGPPGPLQTPLFRVYPGATGQAWHAFSPQWTLILEGTPDPVVIEWRWRSSYCLTDWTPWYTSEFTSRYLMGTIDFSHGPMRDDDRLAENELGVEIRCRWGSGRRHELHVFPLTHKDYPNKTHMEHTVARIPADVWFEPTVAESAPSS